MSLKTKLLLLVTVSITASVGAAGNLSVACSSSTSQATYFSTPSFTCAGVTLSGGQDPSGVSLDHNFFVTQLQNAELKIWLSQQTPTTGYTPREALTTSTTLRAI